jgi:redox-sensitive bicupin YhaK (pirin superfamily)
MSEATVNEASGSDRQRIRSVARIVEGVATSDGQGVALTRVIGSAQLDMLDPFLLLDVIGSDNPGDYMGGFPEHPHRGFETVTYMLAGRVRHEDSAGHSGVVESGGVQWMTAGRGVLHSEMPEQEEGLLWGFQLWINLPAAQKWVEPRYQEFPAAGIPLEHRGDGTGVRVIAGQTGQGTAGPVKNVTTEPLYLEVTVGVDGVFVESVPRSHNAFLYVIEGAVNALGERREEDRLVEAKQLAVFGPGDRVQLAGAGPANRLLFVSARRLEEPVARGGPFVMNTREEVLQAFEDFRHGRF